MKDIIYPNIDIKEAKMQIGTRVNYKMNIFIPRKKYYIPVVRYHFMIRTTLRMKHTDGKYYFAEIMNRSVCEEDNDIKEFRDSFVQQFIKTVYNHIVCGIVVPDITDVYDKPVFVLDDNQDSEEERIKRLLNYNEAGI